MLSFQCSPHTRHSFLPLIEGFAVGWRACPTTPMRQGRQVEGCSPRYEILRTRTGILLASRRPALPHPHRPARQHRFTAATHIRRTVQSSPTVQSGTSPGRDRGLHWCDPTTLEVVREILQEIPGCPSCSWRRRGRVMKRVGASPSYRGCASASARRHRALVVKMFEGRTISDRCSNSSRAHGRCAAVHRGTGQGGVRPRGDALSCRPQGRTRAAISMQSRTASMAF